MNGEERLSSKLTKVSVSCSIVAKRRINLNERSHCAKIGVSAAAAATAFCSRRLRAVHIKAIPAAFTAHRPARRRSKCISKYCECHHLAWAITGSGKKWLSRTYFDLGSLRQGKDNIQSNKKLCFRGGFRGNARRFHDSTISL